MEHLVVAQFGIEGIESVLRAILYFVITIFVLVTVHEFGHFIAGRIFGMRVPVFSVGMGRRIFGFNKIDGFTMGPLNPETELHLENHTDYRLSLLPIGGYAKIEGMIDETQTEALPSEIQPWEFRAKPWWQKSIVISAGVILNLILAWVIFTGRDLATGLDVPKTTTVGYVRTGSISEKAGIRPGDKILAVAGKPISNWMPVDRAPIDNYGRDFSITFEHEGHQYSALYRADDMGSIKDISKPYGLDPVGFTPPVLDSVVPHEPASRAGLLKGDSILSVNGIPIPNVSAFIDQVSSHPSKPITIELIRTAGSSHTPNASGAPISITVTPDPQGKIGVIPASDFVGPKAHINYGLLGSISDGWYNLKLTTRLTVETIRQIFQGRLKVQEALGGPIKIAAAASASASGGLDSFIQFMAMLSISLALLNILPLPALDGGHLVIILIEAVVGHELSQRFKLNFQKIGVAILLFLMVFMVFNDISGLVKGL